MKDSNFFFSLILLALLLKYITMNCSDSDAYDICLECSSDHSECITCKTGYYLSSGECFNCPSGCSTCSNSDVCSSCNDGYYLSGTSCDSCDSDCKTCIDSPSNCTSCNDGKYLSASSCYPCSSD